MTKEEYFVATLKEIFDEEGHENFGLVSCKEVAKRMKITAKEVRKLAMSSKYCPTANGKIFKSFLVVIY